jgi:hypothetical protein
MFRLLFSHGLWDNTCYGPPEHTEEVISLRGISSMLKVLQSGAHMSALSSAKHDHIRHLLELFPVKAIKQHWQKERGKKESIAATVASKYSKADILRFVDELLSCSKQHIYIFNHNGAIKEIPDVESGEMEAISDVGTVGTYLMWCDYIVLLDGPMERKTVKFLWPIRIELTKEHVVIRLVILEKDISAHFPGRTVYTSKKNLEDADVLQFLIGAFQKPLPEADLNKGIKELWAKDTVDCTRTQYKRPLSTVTEVMDQSRGIKKHNPELYKALVGCPLYKSLFVIESKEFSTARDFSIDPSRGSIAFSKYTEVRGDTDNVIREILRLNK